MNQVRSKLSPALLWGGLTVVALYSALYVYEKEIIELSTRGGWFFLVPLLIAFAFSFFHGKFTGEFWELFGIKAK